MRNRYIITCLVINRVINKKSARKMNARCLASLYQYMLKKSVFDKKATVLVSIGTNISMDTKASYKLAKDILEFMGKEFNKVYHDIYRAFYIFFTDVHTVNIPQNYVKCKHKVRE